MAKSAEKIEKASAPNEAKKTASNSKKELEVRFLISPSGVYLLPYSIGEVVSLPENQATELVENKFAEFVQ